MWESCLERTKSVAKLKGEITHPCLTAVRMSNPLLLIPLCITLHFSSVYSDLREIIFWGMFLATEFST